MDQISRRLQWITTGVLSETCQATQLLKFISATMQYLFKTCKARETHSEFMLPRQDSSHDRIRLFAVFEACN